MLHRWSCGDQLSCVCSVCLSDSCSWDWSHDSCCFISGRCKSPCRADCIWYRGCWSSKQIGCRIWTRIICTGTSMDTIDLIFEIIYITYPCFKLCLPHKDSQSVLYWTHSNNLIRSFDFHYMHERIFPLLFHYYQCTCSSLDLILYPDKFSKWLNWICLTFEISPRNDKLDYYSRRNPKYNSHHMDNLQEHYKRMSQVKLPTRNDSFIYTDRLHAIMAKY